MLALANPSPTGPSFRFVEGCPAITLPMVWLQNVPTWPEDQCVLKHTELIVWYFQTQVLLHFGVHASGSSATLRLPSISAASRSTPA